ncbi:AraC family transcriptional regulator [Hoyosella sp. YIM 151337]|uniref:AraC family transcriptional regulator n=1 Tax=Hoyosella sp. YIM 151337 TaxID=2992742 RepID=UPI002236AB30|nr:AraC family transcriptional regulator [Hoyosella sp. YIM 151337]MCW4352647.1 AraC family transcriptional regulator [Hoyosella sp. YIM 151337]
MPAMPGGNAPDWDDAERVVSHAYFPHNLTPLDTNAAPALHVKALPLGPMRLTRITWGASVSVHTSHPGGYAVNIPMSGQIESTSQGHTIVSGQGAASVFRPDTPAAIDRWTDDCEIVGVRFDRDYLHREMTRVLGRPDQHLPWQADLTTKAGQSWMSLLRSVVVQLRADTELWRNPLVAEQLAGALTTSFVLATMPAETESTAHARPRIIKRVLDRIHDDPAQPWTSAEMAQIAGVSVRRLQEGFREYLGMCPRDYVQDVRLEHIHQELASGDSATSVTDVAMRWGMTHTGRFAAAYRKKYGVAPSQTLRGT